MIPLSIPNLNGNEWKYVKDCLDSNWISSVGSYVDKFENAVTKYTKSKYAVACGNGTLALHMSLMLAGVEENDMVLAPDITFIASVNSICYVKAIPVLIDVDQNTWQMDCNLLEKFLSENCSIKNNACYHSSGRRVKAIMPVHVLGNMCDMKRIISIASAFHFEIIEDATEALGSFQSGKHAGTFGKFGSLSFNGNKIMTTGGGGMILTDDKQLAEKAKHLTTQAKSDSFEYMHDEVGYNYRLVNILAAIGCAQMEQLPAFLKRKSEIKKFYDDVLKTISSIKLQRVTSDTVANNWLYTIYAEKQEELIKKLLENEIQVRKLWVPMHSLKMFSKNIFVTESDISQMLYQHCISIPCSTNITDEELKTVADAILNFFH